MNCTTVVGIGDVSGVWTFVFVGRAPLLRKTEQYAKARHEGLMFPSVASERSPRCPSRPGKKSPPEEEEEHLESGFEDDIDIEDMREDDHYDDLLVSDGLPYAPTRCHARLYARLWSCDLVDWYLVVSSWLGIKVTGSCVR